MYMSGRQKEEGVGRKDGFPCLSNWPSIEMVLYLFEWSNCPMGYQFPHTIAGIPAACAHHQVELVFKPTHERTTFSQIENDTPH